MKYKKHIIIKILTVIVAPAVQVHQRERKERVIERGRDGRAEEGKKGWEEQ